jgi:hypothetical protein
MRSGVLFRLLLLLPCLASGTCYAQSLPTPTIPQVVPPPAETPVAPTRPVEPIEGPSDAKKQQSPEVMLDNCKKAYDQLQSENDLLRSKGYAAQEGYNQYFYGDYARKVAEIRLSTFTWQARASEILIWVVVIVCLSGVLFSGYQLWRATAPRPVGGSADKSNADPLATNVELSWQSVRVTSSVIGLVVLVISVAYLYLFLKEVYHISTVGEAISTPAITAGSAPQETTPNPVPK